MIDINGIGPFGRVIEMFAEKFLHAGVKRVSYFYMVYCGWCIKTSNFVGCDTVLVRPSVAECDVVV